LLAEAIVLFLHVWLDMLLYMSFQRCSLEEEASALSVHHVDLWRTTAIDDSDDVLVGLYIVCHEAFEVGLLHTVLSHEFIEFSPHNALDLSVFQLHVTYGNGHDLAIHYNVHMTCHCGPLLDTLDMVKHEPRVLHISSLLHVLHEVHATSRLVYQHL
jgi:hypothetical protein